MASEDSKDRVTSVLLNMQARGEQSDARLDPILYEEMHRIAEQLMRRERAAHTLQATALVNEAWMRLVDSTRVNSATRPVFLGLAARTMRRILVDHARTRMREKRGGGWRQISMSSVTPTPHPTMTFDILGLDAALSELHKLSERRATIVEMHFFGSMTFVEIAEVLQMSESAIRLDWYAARAWLSAKLPQPE